MSGIGNRLIKRFWRSIWGRCGWDLHEGYEPSCRVKGGCVDKGGVYVIR